MKLSYVEGVNPSKWIDVWNARHPFDRMEAWRVAETAQWVALDAGECDAALIRLPQERASDGTSRGFGVELFRERTVVLLPAGHPYADIDDLASTDIGDLERTPAQSTVEETIALTAAGVGVVELPASVARLYSRRDVVVKELSDGPDWPVFLAWRIDDDNVQDLVGIVRGRTARSSR